MTDGFSQADIDGYFSGTLGSAAAPAAPAAPAPIADPRFEKYDKMKKMLPEGAVRQKMLTDGFSQADIDAYFSGSPTNASSASSGAPAGLPVGGGLPKPNPLGGLAKAGFANVVEAAMVQVPPGMKEKPKVVPPVKMKGLFWTKIKPEEIKNTIWNEVGGKAEVAFDSEDLKYLESEFGAAPAKTAAPESAASTSATKAKAITLLDGKRVQSVLISLGKLRQTPDQIKEMIIQLDPKVLTSENTITLLNIVPTKEELALITAHEEPETLDKGDKLYLALSEIPRLEQRLKCHEVAFRWNTDADASSSQINILVAAVKELTDSGVS